MDDRITCFKLNWYDCGLSCADSVLNEEITIYRNNSCMVFKQLNGYGVVCSCEIIHVEQDRLQKFFGFLEQTYNEWESDYMVEVCDGSRWEVRMWHSSHKVKKVCGTVEYPPHGKKIERFIRSFIDAGNGAFEPILFGCG
jgi:hypothetical protein